ncbi:MAG: hypothetical protein R3335_08700 [Anaerolineales bacterium]|nr:hypothetical protein [Anaerolineales bacterium]
MAKKGKNRAKKQDADAYVNEPWISQRSGKIIITVLSTGLAVWMTWQITPALGLAEAALWGIGFGASIWLIFLGMQYFQKWIRRQ